MRTTLDIHDDVLLAAKERAQREKKTLGEMISDLARCFDGGTGTGAGRPPAKGCIRFQAISAASRHRH
jgi:hypothetical protein